MSGGSGEKVSAAFLAMKDLGIPRWEVWPVLKTLLEENEHNWELIEDDNYRLLADQIFEAQEKEIEDMEKEAGNSSSVSSKSQKDPVVDESSSSSDESEERNTDGGERFLAAIHAMGDLGIPRKEVIRVVLTLFSKKCTWDLVEEDNYHFLANQILEAQEKEIEEKKEAGNSSLVSVGLAPQKKPVVDEPSSSLSPAEKRKLFEGKTAGPTRCVAAIHAMGDLGIPGNEVVPVMARLFSKKCTWDCIEDDNYHLLADQIFEAQKEIEKKKKEAGSSSLVNVGLVPQKKPVVDEPSSSLNPVKKRKLDEREEGMVLGTTSKKAVQAILAMRELGIHRDVIKPVLVRLLKENEDNWELIEDANCQLLVDQIIKAQDKKGIYRGCRYTPGLISLGRPCPRPQKKPEAHESSSSLNPQKKPKLDERAEGMVPSSTRKMATAAIRAMKEFGIPAHEAAQVLIRLLEDSENRFEFVDNTNYRLLADQIFNVLDKKDEEKKKEETGKSSSHGTGSQKKRVAGESSSFMNPLKKRKLGERPENLPIVKEHPTPVEEPQLEEPLPVICLPAPPPDLQGEIWGEGPSVMNDPTPLNVSQPPEEHDSPKEKENQVESLTIAAFTNETIASSHSGEVKLLLTCTTDRPGFQVPNMEDVFKMVEDGCVKSYKVLQPNFSLMNVMKEICQCALDLGSESNGTKGGITKEGEGIGNVNDVGKGKEILRIAIEKDSPVQIFPAPFYYMRNNYSFEKTQVEVSHARIGEQDCCANCIADCLHSPIPCACARKTGGEFAYSPDGLIKNKFLEESISMKRNPEKLRLFYCKSCPLERAKNKVTPDSCKGHLIRKFVKECGSKCGCSKQCRNRVVQNGITCNLEVFFTGEAKQWGVRTLDRLPRGAFVCEYAGEILTNMDVYAQARQTMDNGRYTYPIILDGAWGTKEVLKDEEALCLDVTKFGNVARFVNHRCHDANLIEIPVEVEMPDRHYYRLALFTTKEVEAFEELTWDYGIDFDDHHSPIKAFHCCCGSTNCRDMKYRTPSLRRSQRIQELATRQEGFRAC